MKNSWRKKAKQTWNNSRWWVMIAGAAIVFVFGYTGYREAFQIEQADSLDIFYRVFQLFFLDFDNDISRPVLYLQIARWLAPVISGYSAYRALKVIFREQLQLFKARFLRNHIIICGLGRKGLLLAQRLVEEGKKVVVIEKDENNDNLGQCREKGIIVLVGNAMEKEPLLKARLNRAEYLFCICGEDGVNAGIAFHARSLVSSQNTKSLTCSVHIVDPHLCRLLKEREFETQKKDSFRLEFFNLFDYAARSIIENFSPFKSNEEIHRESPHLLIIGIGNMGESLVIHMAREWMNLTGKPAGKLKISILDRKAGEKKELLYRCCPHLEQVCEVIPLEMEIESQEFEQDGFLYDANKKCMMSSIYVCLDDDSFALRTALSLHRKLRDNDIPIVVRMDRETGLSTLLQGDDHAFARLKVFNFLDKVLTSKMLLLGTNEILARAIHEEYRRKQKEKGETEATNPSLVSWEDLPDTLKHSNRRHAGYMGIKLAQIGCYIIPVTDLKPGLIEFTDEEIEKMAIMEHDHWVEERLESGWKFGPTKNIEKKLSPSLIPWEALSKEEKDKDREPVREMPAFLAGVGFQVCRREIKE